mmetsp:Transcript_9817/g.12964  ORF Transcript_9817/g.12964 Transcript_9817/m.12964 type:complete len:87 (+) Transcript_9817:93-353(+)|eukprot:CAMPEP_0198136458 /NCGR_PEP_ID=MMETSP1443-20131203/108_1 /TAXON_ID=186043 /ORGANISM="Entomoneis sp., Strain CCMP2396" /LENGTH=86 /DNA_ID=CAMNT_0043797683 /DNA_START=56 /DNA_END=316 /DNA_ORIENTATION=+
MHSSRALATAGRIINKNPYLFGPGPVKRKPSGTTAWFANQDPVTGFSWAASVGVGIAFAGSMAYKVLILDPQINAIETYYKENPPK